MKTVIALLVAVAVVLPLTAYATEGPWDLWDPCVLPDSHTVSGDVWGTWTAPDTYYVIGEVRVPPESTLVIEPGVTVLFWSYYKFIVDSNATLLAVGTESDSILFSTPFPQNGWHGLRFFHANSNSQLSYCRIEYGKALGSGGDEDGGAIYCYYSNITISNNTITENWADAAGTGGGISCNHSDPTITENVFINNSAYYGAGNYCNQSSPTIGDNAISGNFAGGEGGGIYCYNSSPTISNNTIRRNSAHYGGGIACRHFSSPTITANTISGNSADSCGGILCWNSSPGISNNIISDNSAIDVGGILCYNSSPSIDNNRISTNRAYKFCGGILCWYYSNPTISNNIISGNSADDSSGAGIYCRYYSSPMINNNIISGNSAGYNAGGINCYYYSSPTISDNSITGNSAGKHGGGIRCKSHSSPVITNNIISGNSAALKGGGISCYDESNPTMINNTFSRNSAAYGGGLSSDFSSPIVTNTIFWADSSSSGEIYIEYGSAPEITYCDVQGGWLGQGNIDADPIFVGPYNADFYLRWHSPCIDAGVPDSLDPDGTRSDMGAFYFNQAVLGVIEVYPQNEPIVIPPGGGDLLYDGGVFNFSGGNLTVDIWAYAFVPGFSRPQRIWRYNDIAIPAGDSIIKPNLSESVPGFAPSGDYAFVTYIGDYPASIIDSSCLYFSKDEGGYASSGIDDWRTLKGWLDGDFLSTGSGLPTDYTLTQNYPNPFNARTAISYELPVTRHVKLEVYNLLGEKVATLIDEEQEAGYRSVVWDASKVSSGLYFYKLSAGDFSETKRMMLVK